MIMDEFSMLIRICAAAVLGGIIGFDREQGNKPAGLRTHMLVAVGAAMFVVLGELILEYPAYQDDSMRFDALRIIEAVVGGVAFLGAGTIFFSKGENVVQGLTTAASLWVTAAVGMAAGLEHYVFAVSATIVVVITLQLFRVKSLNNDDKPDKRKASDKSTAGS
jgi:putative Mg2+ transporter-C (MgtC) family protein